MGKPERTPTAGPRELSVEQSRQVVTSYPRSTAGSPSVLCGRCANMDNQGRTSTATIDAPLPRRRRTTKAVETPDDTEALIHDAVKKKMGLFRHFPDFGVDDGLQICRIEVEKAREAFDPGVAKWSTWVTTICARRMIDAHRRRVSLANREGKYAAGRDYAPSSHDNQRDSKQTCRRVPVYHANEDVVDPPDQIEGEGEVFEGEIVADSTEGPTLAEWFSHVVRLARRLCKDESRQGHTYEPWQAPAVKAIAQKNGTSVRGTRGLFEDREDLRRLIGFDVSGIPSHGFFQRAID